MLLLGESGTGQEPARAVHPLPEHAAPAGPLVEVHCAALPETLLEGELFGHEKGAFTGATQRKAGHLAAADGGTLFLDEIGEITPATQVKLLRFLQDRRVRPARRDRRSARWTSASSPRRTATSTAAVATGAFREDLYYRLNVFAIRAPAAARAAARTSLPLAERFLARARPAAGEALVRRRATRLLAHGWPGNVRELENALERALILAGEGELRPEHLATGRRRTRPRAATPRTLVVEGFSLDAFERELLLAALERAGGNKTHAARLLGVTRRRLYSLLASSGGDPGDDPG